MLLLDYISHDTTALANEPALHSHSLTDESFAVSHNKRGILGMANQGPHSNGSQFYITLQPTQWMDRKYVAFG